MIIDSTDDGLMQGSATQNVERAILDQKKQKRICLEPQKMLSLIMKATHAVSVYISYISLLSK